jgi:(p)ppGpp synthase/HD superfamily hydrolase
MDLERRALEFAALAHDGQYRKDGKTPYINHPIEVVRLLEDVGVKDSEVLAAGYLHDVQEDCDVSNLEIRNLFGLEVARIVGALTRDVNRSEYKERIRSSDYNIQIVKLADTVHNCKTLNEGMSVKSIKRKVEDCRALYFEMAEDICPEFHEMLIKAIIPWENYRF